MSKIWFVTGANSGIGSGIVQAALDAGDQVVATGRNMGKLHAAFPGKHDGLALIELDVTNREQADRGRGRRRRALRSDRTSSTTPVSVCSGTSRISAERISSGSWR